MDGRKILFVIKPICFTFTCHSQNEVLQVKRSYNACKNVMKLLFKIGYHRDFTKIMGQLVIP